MRTCLRLSLAIKTGVRTSLHSKEIISTNPRPKSVYDFGLVCCFIVYCVIVLSPALHNVFHIPMARYRLACLC